MNALRRSTSLLTGLFLAITPGLALACPQCAGRPGGGNAQLVLLGSFILLPFAVAAVVYRFVKASEDSSPSTF